MLAFAAADFAQTAGLPGRRHSKNCTWIGLRPAWRIFIKLRIGTAKRLAGAVDRHYPKFYASVRLYTLEVEKHGPAIARYLERYRELYPEAHFPPVYFVIGRLASSGTTSDHGLLIGTEVNSLGAEPGAGDETMELA
jgi:hypothetical protein